jgi:hypothetical protein
MLKQRLSNTLTLLHISFAEMEWRTEGPLLCQHEV